MFFNSTYSFVFLKQTDVAYKKFLIFRESMV